MQQRSRFGVPTPSSQWLGPFMLVLTLLLAQLAVPAAAAAQDDADEPAAPVEDRAAGRRNGNLGYDGSDQRR